MEDDTTLHLGPDTRQYETKEIGSQLREAGNFLLKCRITSIFAISIHLKNIQAMLNAIITIIVGALVSGWLPSLFKNSTISLILRIVGAIIAIWGIVLLVQSLL